MHANRHRSGRSFIAATVLMLTVLTVQAGETVLSFTGNNSYVNVGITSVLQIPSSSPLTFESWVYLNALSSRDILYSKNNGRSSGYTYMFGFIENGRIAAYPSSGSWMEPSPAVTVAIGQWYHMAFSFDGTTMSYYTNGVLAGTSGFSFANNTGHSVKIGGYIDSADINGYQSEARIWDHARSQAEIQANMGRRLTGSEPGLLGYWPLNEGSGTIAYDGTANASDGDINNASWIVSDLDFKPVIDLFDLETGNGEYTNSNKVEVVFGGALDDYNRYQFSETNTQPTAGWLVFDPTNPPPTATFTIPDPEGPVTLYCWFTNSAETISATVASNTITYIREDATLSAQATNITRTLFGTNNAVIFFDSIDIGSTSDPLDIYRISLFSEDDLTPELYDRVTIANPQSYSNDYTVTLEIMDLAGNTGRDEAQVTLLWIEDGYGNYVWNGAGVSGGTENTQWLNGDNWLVDSVVPASPPGLNDDVGIALNTAHDNPDNPNVAVEVGAGATARHVAFSGMNGSGRRVEFQGDTTFATLNYATTRSTLNIVEDATLTLTGGEFNPDTEAVVKATFLSPGVFSVYNILSFPGKIRCTSDQVVLRLNGVDGDIYVDNPDATIHFHNTQVRMGGDLFVYGSQRVIGLHSSVGMAPTRYSKDLYRQDGNALTNWAACHIGGMSYTMSSGAPFTLPAGTYGSVAVTYRGHYSGNVWYAISGDVTFVGANASGYAVEVQRRRLTNANGSYFSLNGNNLTVTNGGLIMVCEFTDPDLPEENRNTDPIWWNRIEAEGSTVTTDGDINIGPGGYFTGDADTTIALEGNWDNRSQWQNNNFTLATSTLIVNGSALPQMPQLLEAQSEDMGPTLDGMLDNHAIGRLEIGTPEQPTHARLADVDDYKEDELADAFYVAELVVHSGSILDIYGLELYVNGVSVRGRWRDFGDGLVTDSTIPSGTLIMVR